MKKKLFLFVSGRSQDYFQGTHGERAEVVRQNDNLSLEGTHSMTKKDATVYKGERAAVVKHSDNLRVEGKFEGRAKEASVKRGERMSVVKHKDNLKMEGKIKIVLFTKTNNQ